MRGEGVGGRGCGDGDGGGGGGDGWLYGTSLLPRVGSRDVQFSNSRVFSPPMFWGRGTVEEGGEGRGVAGGGISPALTLYGWTLYEMTGCLLIGVCGMGLPDGGRGEGTGLLRGGQGERLFDVAVALYCTGRMSDRRTRIVWPVTSMFIP